MNGSPRRPWLGLAFAAALAFATIQAMGWWSGDRLGREVAATARPGDIQMIASTTCIYCAQARAWFQVHHVPYTECLIERDPACAARYAALMAPGTPVLVVRGTPRLGFDPEVLAEALRRASPAPPSPRTPPESTATS